MSSSQNPTAPERRRRAAASEYRVHLAEEDRRQLVLDLASLIKPPERHRRTFGETAAEWLRGLVRVCPENEQRHLWHLWPLWELREPGAAESEDDLTKARIDACLAAADKRNGGTLTAATLNKLRSTGKLAVDDAIANGRWRAANPFDFVQPRRVPKKPFPRITTDELARALACMRPDRMRECIWQIHAGTRPGELKALRKSDVDLAAGFVEVQRSNSRDETKTGRSRRIPIPAGARAALEEAMRLSPSDFVFPNPDGSQQRADAKLSKTLRSALKRAGVITGYAFTCRRKGCGFAEEISLDAFRRGAESVPIGVRHCPNCSFKLWCEPVPKHFTWYGLRHAAATLHRESGADALAVKMALGHVPRDVTDDVYTHLSDERFKAELGRFVVKPKG